MKKPQILEELLYKAYAGLQVSHIIATEEKSFSNILKAGKEGIYFGRRNKFLKEYLSGMRTPSPFFNEGQYSSNSKCCYCQRTDNLQNEHIIPKSLAKRLNWERGLTLDNHIKACKSCNARKNTQDMLAWLLENKMLPSIVLYRRYLKLAIDFCKEKELMKLPLTNFNPEMLIFDPFSVEKLVLLKQLDGISIWETSGF